MNTAHDPRCAAVFENRTGQNGCNCWSYDYKPETQSCGIESAKDAGVPIGAPNRSNPIEDIAHGSTHAGYSTANPTHISEIIPTAMEELCTAAHTVTRNATVPRAEPSTVPAGVPTATKMMSKESKEEEQCSNGALTANSGSHRTTTEIGVTNMAASLPAVSLDTIDPEVQREIASLNAIKANLDHRIQKLGVTAMIASELHELDTAAKHWLESHEKQRVEMKKPILEAARKQDAYWGDRMKPVAALRIWCSRGLVRYDLEQQEKAAAINRENERIAREAAERQRQAEADAIFAQAADTPNKDESEALMVAAIEKADEPVIPISTPEVAPDKLPGVSVSYKLVGTVEDPISYLFWLLDIPIPEKHWPPLNSRLNLINEAVEFKQSGIDAQLKRGLRPPGVDIERKPMPRNVSRR